MGRQAEADERAEQEKQEKMAHALKICNHLFKGKETIAMAKTFRTWDGVCTEMRKKEEAMERALTICNHLFKGKETIAVAKTFRTWNTVRVEMQIADEKRRTEQEFEEAVQIRKA